MQLLANTFITVGTHPSRRDADLSNHAHHVNLQATTRPIWLQWACHQLTSRRRVICHQPTQISVRTGCVGWQEGDQSHHDFCGLPTTIFTHSAADVQWPELACSLPHPAPLPTTVNKYLIQYSSNKRPRNAGVQLSLKSWSLLPFRDFVAHFFSLLFLNPYSLPYIVFSSFSSVSLPSPSLSSSSFSH